VRATVAVCEVLPLVPFTVMVWLPVAAVRLTVIFMVEEPDVVNDDGVKLTVTPLGTPLAVRLAAVVSVPVIETEMLTDPELLLATLVEVGFALMELNVALPPPPPPPVPAATSAETRLAVGLPQPVTRSYPVVAE
jgi:hypothetical protein